jgi:hypothetical protein
LIENRKVKGSSAEFNLAKGLYLIKTDNGSLKFVM